MSERLFSLMERHQRLDELLHRARTRQMPDPFQIAHLKKLKLAVKDRIARMMRDGKIRK